MTGHPERITPDETPTGVIEHHLAKYRFAIGHDLGDLVLDAACGVGYASAFAAGATSAHLVGVDIAGDAMAVAARRYRSARCGFVRADVTRLPLRDGTFTGALGFETVEHITGQDEYLSEIRRVLRSGGTFVCSTPFVTRTDTAPANPFHVLELDPADFEVLLRRHFDGVALYSQRRTDTRRARALRRADLAGIRRRLPPGLLRLAGRAVGTPATADRAAEDFEIVAGVAADATEILAVCR
jgi:SAM-dependent methyltransferase